MSKHTISRRNFIRQSALGLGTLSLGTLGLHANALVPSALALGNPPERPPYDGPNVILVRFGGGVRRQETIADIHHTWCPYLMQELVPRGVFFPNMEIEQLDGVETSHGQGTLYLLTGKYDQYKDIGNRFLGQRFESKVPTVFEYLRQTYDVPEHQALIINGEDRTDEEFYTFSNHHLFGVHYRSTVLSLYRYKTYLLRRSLLLENLDSDTRQQKKDTLAKMESLDYRVHQERSQPEAIEAFWEDWRAQYGESGLVNPRGDRLLTELAVQALHKLQPRLMMINYNDPDYVHWGNPAHYFNGISIMDQGLRRLVATVENLPDYRENTVFMIVPDCGRENNRAVAVPFQHHFGGRSSREIFALTFGTGIAQGEVVDRAVQQCDVAGTLGAVMGFQTPHVEGGVLEEIFA